MAAGVRICVASDAPGEIMCVLHDRPSEYPRNARVSKKANLFDPHTSSLSPSSPSISRVFAGAAVGSERGAAVLLGTASLCMVPAPTNCWFATAAAAAATEVATTTPLMSTFEDFGGRE